LLLVVLLPEEVEALIAGDIGHTLFTGLLYAPDANEGVDLPWHLGALRGDPNQLSWRIRVIVEKSSNTVVGSIN
jgi:hypothetical protein